MSTKYVPEHETVQARNMLYLADDSRIPKCWREWLRANIGRTLAEEEVSEISALRADISKGIIRSWQ